MSSQSVFIRGVARGGQLLLNDQALEFEASAEAKVLVEKLELAFGRRLVLLPDGFLIARDFVGTLPGRLIVASPDGLSTVSFPVRSSVFCPHPPQHCFFAPAQPEQDSTAAPDSRSFVDFHCQALGE